MDTERERERERERKRDKNCEKKGARLEVTLSTSGWRDNKKTGQQHKQQQQQRVL